MKRVFYGTVSNKVLRVQNKFLLDSYVAGYPDSTEFEISLHPVNDSRSARQNKLYWMYLRKISRAYGEHTAELFHDYFKDKYLCYTVIIAKEEIRQCKSTADLSKKEFSEYIEAIIEWAAIHLQLVLATEEERLFLSTID